MKLLKNQFLLKNFVEKKSFVEKSFIKLNIIFFDLKNSSFILGKKNNVFFYKIDKLFLFLNEILYFYLNFFKERGNSLFFFEEKLMFLFGREACLRSFQTIFFGSYRGGIFNNNIKFKFTKMLKNIFVNVDIFFFVFVKNLVFSFKDLTLLNKPSVVLSSNTLKLNNYIFYKMLFHENLFSFCYLFLKLLSDVLIKIQLINYIKIEFVH